MKPRTLVALLAVLATAVAIWLAATGSEPEPATPADDAPAEITEKPRRRRDVARGAAPAQPEPPVATESTGPPSTAPDVPLEDGVIRLRGSVVDAAGAAVAGARARVRGALDDGGLADCVLALDTARDGTFAVDVNEIFAGDAVVQLQVSAEHPDHFAGKAVVEIPEDGPADDLTVRVRLLAAALVTGTVKDDSGAPLANVAVATFPISDDDRWNSLDDGETAADGRFRLRARPGAEHYVMAATAGRLPAFVRVTADTAVPVEAGAMVLRDGARLAGRVLSGSGPLAGAKVKVWTRWLERSLRVGSYQLTFGDGIAGHWPRVVETGPDGRYAVAGLHPGATRVVVDIPGAALNVQHELDRNFEAPTETADFDVALSRLIVEIRADAEPLHVSHFMVHGGSGTSGVETDADGRKELLVLPETEYTIDIRLDGYERAVRTITSPAAGLEHVERIDLVPFRPRPTLSVELVSPTGERIEKCVFWLFTEGKERLNPHFADVTRQATLVGGRFEVSDVDPGRYRLMVKPGASGWGGEGHYLAIESEIELPQVGRLELRHDVRVGGRFRITAVGPDGEPMFANCTIRDIGGNVVPVAFLQRRSFSSALGQGDNLVEPPLPPGRYEIEITQRGHVGKTVTAIAEPGKTTDVRVQLAADTE